MLLEKTSLITIFNQYKQSELFRGKNKSRVLKTQFLSSYAWLESFPKKPQKIKHAEKEIFVKLIYFIKTNISRALLSVIKVALLRAMAIRGGSRTAATSKLELLVIIVNSFQLFQLTPLVIQLISAKEVKMNMQC